jgi:hypothetical protein
MGSRSPENLPFPSGSKVIAKRHVEIQKSDRFPQTDKMGGNPAQAPPEAHDASDVETTDHCHTELDGKPTGVGLQAPEISHEHLSVGRLPSGCKMRFPASRELTSSTMARKSP